MKNLLVLFVLLLFPGTLLAGDSVSVPWEEFKILYKESIERELTKDIEKKPIPAVYSFEEAVYHLKIGTEKARGELLLTGKVISGKPGPIPLFDREIVIDHVKQVAGGFLMCDRQHDDFIAFLPDDNENFQISVTFFVSVKEDSQSRFVSFQIPTSLRNALSLELSADTRLIDPPGIKDSAGTYHFSATPCLTVRFSEGKGLAVAPVVEIDTLSRIWIQGKQAIVSTSFLPVKPLPCPLVLEVHDDARYIASSLKNSWIKKIKENKYQLNLPAGAKDIFSIQFAHGELETAGKYSFSLPKIGGNDGKQGNFILQEPEDGQITPTGDQFVTRIPVSRLKSKLQPVAGKDRFFMKMRPHGNVDLLIKRFQPVNTPPIVLDSISFFTSFEDNGSILSALIMDIPPEAGKRVSLRALPETEIWHLKVNGKRTKIYEARENSPEKTGNDKWIIPLVRGETSHVELAFIRKGRKPGLHGRLETVLPETGLPSRRVHVGIALPERLQLLSLEGPVSPAVGESWQKPAEFIGKPYYFSRSFYKGEGLKMAISYKEPVRQIK